MKHSNPKPQPSKAQENYAKKLRFFTHVELHKQALLSDTLSKLAIQKDAIHTRHMLQASEDGHAEPRQSFFGHARVYVSFAVMALVFLVGGLVVFNRSNRSPNTELSRASSSIVADGSVKNAVSAISATVQEETELSQPILASTSSAASQIQNQTQQLEGIANE